MPIVMVHLVDSVRCLKGHLEKLVESGQRNRSIIGRKAIEKVRAYAKSNAHILATQEAVVHQTSQQVGSVVQQLQAVA